MKLVHFLALMMMAMATLAQTETRISSIDFVQVLDNNHEEARYYYENNWRWLRALAVEKGYISDYAYYLVERTEETPYDMILVTVYANQEQANRREDHFAELIEQKGGLRLLNDKKPATFRKLLAGHEEAIHMDK